MALTDTEMQVATRRYFMADDKKAIDIYFNDSYFMVYFMRQQKGIWERPDGGDYIAIPINYDGAEGGFYDKTSTLSSDERATVNNARFTWKHLYANATIHRIDEQKNRSAYQDINLLAQRISNAQKQVAKDISSNVHNSAADGAIQITGSGSLFNTTTSVKYGDLAEADLAAQDGTLPWAAKVTTTTEGIHPSVIRTLATSAKISDGPKGKPDVGFMPEALWNVFAQILLTQQRYTEDKDLVNAGWQNIVFEGKKLFPDDYMPSGTTELFNSQYIGFAVHKTGYFARDQWQSLISNGKPARAMKIYWDGNMVCSNRKAHARHTNLS